MPYFMASAPVGATIPYIFNKTRLERLDAIWRNLKTSFNTAARRKLLNLVSHNLPSRDRPIRQLSGSPFKRNSDQSMGLKPACSIDETPPFIAKNQRDDTADIGARTRQGREVHRP